MNVVLVALGPSVPGDGLVAGVESLRRAGASSVVLVHRRPPSPALVAVLDAAVPLPPPGPLGGLRAAVAGALNHLPKVRLDPDRLAAAVRVTRSTATRTLVTGADVLVAVDQAAIPAVWLAARRTNRSAAALSGLPAAVARSAR